MPMTPTEYTWQLLMECAREIPRPRLRELLEQPPSKLDMHALARGAFRARLGPHLVHALYPLEGCNLSMVDELLRLCRPLLYGKWLRERSVLGALDTALQAAAADRGIPWIPLRGPAFAERYYQRPELRVSRDLDALVPRASFGCAGTMLQELGFFPAEAPAFREAKAFYQGQLAWRHADSGVLLDLNWRLTANAGIGPVEQCMDDLWSRCARNTQRGWRLAPEDELLYLLRHLGHGHDFSQGILRGCVDIEAFLRHHPDLDIDYFRLQAGCAESLRASGLLLHFFMQHYRPEAAIGERAARLLPPPPGAALGVRCVLKPLARGLVGTPMKQALRRNLQVFAKFFFLDRPARLAFLLRVLARPTPDEKTLLFFNESQGRPTSLRRLLATLVLAPGIAAGAAARLGARRYRLMGRDVNAA